jgi:hypothetical protein
MEESTSTFVKFQIRAEAEAEARKMNLNSVCLCFEAFVRENDILQSICPPIFSEPINNMSEFSCYFAYMFGICLKNQVQDLCFS